MSSKESFPAMLLWQKKAITLDIPGPPKTGTRAHSPTPPFYKNRPQFFLSVAIPAEPRGDFFVQILGDEELLEKYW